VSDFSPYIDVGKDLKQLGPMVLLQSAQPRNFLAHISTIFSRNKAPPPPWEMDLFGEFFGFANVWKIFTKRW